LFAILTRPPGYKRQHVRLQRLVGRLFATS
jgi:hypothetical protein